MEVTWRSNTWAAGSAAKAGAVISANARRVRKTCLLFLVHCTAGLGRARAGYTDSLMRLILFAVLLACLSVSAQSRKPAKPTALPPGDWPTYTRDLAGTRFSP